MNAVLIVFFLVSCALFFCVLHFHPVFAVGGLLFLSTLERFDVHCFGMAFSVTKPIQVAFLSAYCGFFFLRRDVLDYKSAIPVILIAAVSLLSSPFSIHPLHALFSALKLMIYFACFYAVAGLVRRYGRKEHLLPFFSALLLFLAVFSVVYVLSNPLMGREHFQAGFTDWNYFAVVVVLLLPFFAAHTDSRDWRVSYLAWFLFGLSFVLVYAAHSRSGLVLLVLAAVFMACLRFFDRKIVLAAAGLAVIGLLAFFVRSLAGEVSILERIGGVFSNPRIQERAQTAVLAFIAFVRNPFFGVGSGQFEAYTYTMFPDMPTFSAQSTYSSFMTLLAENGIAGGLAYTYFFVSLFDRIKMGSSAFHKPLQTGVWLVVASSFLSAVHLHLFTWCYLAVIEGLIRQDVESTESETV